MPPKLSNRSVAAWGVFALPQTLLAALYPPRCAGCDAFCEPLFCASCRATLQIAPPISDDDETPSREYSLVVPERDYVAAPTLKTRAALLFDGATREALHRFKYEGRTALAAPLAQLLLETLRDSENDAASTRDDFTPAKMLQGFAAEHAATSRDASGKPRDAAAKASHDSAAQASTRALFPGDAPPIFVPIPLHAWRKWRRGYNQSELLARELARFLDAPCLSILRRTRYTVTQTELSREQRLKNMRGAFALNENAARVLARSSASQIILIDDVYTTGATLKEAAHVLRERFPDAKISALTLAYQPPH